VSAERSRSRSANGIDPARRAILELAKMLHRLQQQVARGELRPLRGGAALTDDEV
jgi:hypothetical protein